MAHAYTPGLRVAARTVLHKLRRLPLPGTIHVAVGDRVAAPDVIASTSLPGNVTTVNVAREMNVQPREVPAAMVKQIGDPVSAGDILAETRAMWGLFHSFARSPVSGTVETISEVTGQVLLRGAPTPINLEAYVDGTVLEVQGQEAVLLESDCALLQGIFGLGGETYGELRPLCGDPTQPLTANMIDASCRGQVLVGGSFADLPCLRQAIAVGAAAVVVGGVHDSDVDELLGYHLGVAVTGHEHLGLTLVVTEGFGHIPMAERSFNLLKFLAGRRASVSGATQIRAGVIRPEVIIPHPPEATSEQLPPACEAGLTLGCSARLIREPYFGLLATVVALPEELQTIATESKVRVLVAKLEDGREITVPRANVELIEQ
jgi:hypothetical protein